MQKTFDTALVKKQKENGIFPFSFLISGVNGSGCFPGAFRLLILLPLRHGPLYRSASIDREETRKIPDVSARSHPQKCAVSFHSLIDICLAGHLIGSVHV